LRPAGEKFKDSSTAFRAGKTSKQRRVNFLL
jgi:hypothetical protein